MNDTGTWFAYCERTRVISLADLAAKLAADGDQTVVHDDPALLEVKVHDPLTGNDAAVEVSLDPGPHVVLEAAELAELDVKVDEGVPEPDRARLARCDARYELTWELRHSDETYNTMVSIASELEEACGAIVWDDTNQRFV